MVQGGHIHFLSTHRRMAGSARRLRELLGSPDAINIFEGGNGQRSLKSAGLFSTYPSLVFLSPSLFAVFCLTE
jgi:hypothetical protein